MILIKLILLIALSLFASVKCAEESNDQQEGNSVVLGQLSIALDDIESTVPQDMAIASVTSDQSLASIEVVQGQLQTGGLVQNNNSGDYLSKLEKLKNTKFHNHITGNASIKPVIVLKITMRSIVYPSSITLLRTGM